jgi:hypothetical protein
VRLVDFIKVYQMSHLNPRFWTHRLMTPLIRTRDFRIGRDGMERCLDILAVCSRGGASGGAS